MIFELYIKDFILIEEETIVFKDGLNIITGETGAGKSMVLGAISLVLGETANKESIRQSCERAFIKCTFYANDPANEVLISNGIPIDPDWIVIAREINAKGKSISRINGQIVTLNILKDLTSYLLDIHGQFDNQALFLKHYQLQLIDTFGGDALTELKQCVFETYQKLHIEEKAFEKLLSDHEDKEKQIDFLDYQINEIDAVGLIDGEDTEIEKSFAYYANLESIKSSVDAVQDAFDGEYGEGIFSVLSKLRLGLNHVAKYDPEVAAFAERMDEQYYLLEDLTRDMQHYSEDLTVDPEKRYLLEQRLNDINKLKAKYGNVISDIIKYREKLEDERQYYEEIDAKISTHRDAMAEYENTYDRLAEKLSSIRNKAASAFKKRVTEQLSALNMKAANFDIEIKKTEKRTETGMDDITYMISTNPGQPLKPLKRIVSGGELSRLMLAIKVVLGKEEGMSTQIFDEIDAGISGVTASVVGEKLYQLSLQGQIICITHLPQIAVFADHHFCIQKNALPNKANTIIKAIDEDGIIDEIGRLVGGVAMTDSTRKHVADMLNEARVRKSKQQ